MNQIPTSVIVVSAIILLPMWWKTVPPVYRFFKDHPFLKGSDYYRRSRMSTTTQRYSDAIVMALIYMGVTGFIALAAIGFLFDKI